MTELKVGDIVEMDLAYKAYKLDCIHKSDYIKICLQAGSFQFVVRNIRQETIDLYPFFANHADNYLFLSWTSTSLKKIESLYVHEPFRDPSEEWKYLGRANATTDCWIDLTNQMFRFIAPNNVFEQTKLICSSCSVSHAECDGITSKVSHAIKMAKMAKYI